MSFNTPTDIISDSLNAIHVQRKRFAPMSFFFVAAGAYSQSQSFCEFSVRLSVNQMKITPFSDCSEQMSLASLADCTKLAVWELTNLMVSFKPTAD